MHLLTMEVISRHPFCDGVYTYYLVAFDSPWVIPLVILLPSDRGVEVALSM